MTSHRKRPARRLSGRARAVMSLGAVGFLAIGLGAQGTFAFWTDSATVSPGTFTAGTLDITLNNALSTAGLENNPGTTTLPGFGLLDMAPGESQSVAFPVTNAGTAGLTYTITGNASGTLAPAMKFSVFAGTANASTGTAANNNRSGTCSGDVIAQNLTLGPATPVTTGPRTMTPGTMESICVVASLPIGTGSDNTTQKKTMTASLVFDAKQVGAP